MNNIFSFSVTVLKNVIYFNALNYWKTSKVEHCQGGMLKQSK